MIVYYSKSGNTKRLAEALANANGMEVFSLAAQKPEGMLRGAAKSFFRRSSAVKEMPCLAGAERIILCTPVWAGTFPPVMRGFLQKAVWEDKAVTLLLTCGAPTAAYERKLSALLETFGAKVTLCRAFKGTAAFTADELNGI